MIWTYTSTVPEPREQDLLRKTCLFCDRTMRVLARMTGHVSPGTEIRTCTSCGWWTYWEQLRGLSDRDSLVPTFSLYGAAAQLKAFDPVDISQPLDEVRQYLLAKYEARFELHPRLLELTVASVFHDQGYEAQATAYTSDGGIDVVLSQMDGRTTGVQVKRSRLPIEVEQIRALAGAMILGGHTRGVFVTTSTFRSGVTPAVNRLVDLALPIELVDAGGFLDALRLVQRPPYASYDDWYAANGEIEPATIYENETGRK